jgi:cytokinesis protein
VKAKADRNKDLDVTENEDVAALDNLLEKLRNGDVVGRRQRRSRRNAESNGPSETLSFDGSTLATGETVEIARDMLAQLKSDGFETSTTATSPVVAARRRRRRLGIGSTDTDDWQSIESIRDLVIPESQDEELESD